MFHPFLSTPSYEQSMIFYKGWAWFFANFSVESKIHLDPLYFMYLLDTKSTILTQNTCLSISPVWSVGIACKALKMYSIRIISFFVCVEHHDTCFVYPPSSSVHSWFLYSFGFRKFLYSVLHSFNSKWIENGWYGIRSHLLNIHACTIEIETKHRMSISHVLNDKSNLRSE